MSIFRKQYRSLTEVEKRHIEVIKEFAETLHEALTILPDGREKSLAITKLEEAVMWAVKGVTA